MKTYQKPQIDIMAMLNKENISSGLAGWMEQADVGLAAQNITTYVMNS